MITVILAFADEETRSKFEVLYKRYKEPLFRIIRSILKDDNLSMDALQESYLKVFYNIDKIGEIESDQTKAFLITITKGVAIDFYRKEKKKRELIESEEFPLEYIADDFNVEKIIAHTELSEMLKINVKKLNEIDKNIFTLKYFYFYEEKQIAELIGMSYDNVRKRISRAKKKLASLILNEEEGVFDEL